MENKKEKRYYKKGQLIWSVDLKKEVEVKQVNKNDLTITVLEKTETGVVEHIFPLWSVDVLKYKAKEKLESNKKKSRKLPTIYFAKVRPDAIIPSKREEDAGYDVYANLPTTIVNDKEVKELFLPAFKTTLVPTGIAMALPNTHYLNAKHERGSTGKISMSVLAGVVDSGYRGEIFIAITPLHKDIVITDQVTEVEEYQNGYLYPYSKAIAQATIDLVPKVAVEEITFEELQSIESERGSGALGSSQK